MAAAKGGGLLALLAAPKGGKPGEKPGGDAKTMAAEDMIEAFNSGDASALAAAFQRMYDQCSMGGESEDEMYETEEE